MLFRSIEFEQSIATNPILKEKVALVREINQAIEDEPLAKSVEQQLKFLGNRHFASNQVTKKTSPQQKTTPIHSLTRRKWVIAATILIIVVGGGIIWNMLQNTSTDTTALFANNFEAYQLATRSEVDTNLTEIEQQAIQTYSDAKYTKAIPLFEQLATTPKVTDNQLLALGSCYLHTNQSDKAITTFNKIIDRTESLSHQTAQWYIALAYLQKGDKATAKTKLTELANTGNRLYPKKAKALLKKLL